MNEDHQHSQVGELVPFLDQLATEEVLDGVLVTDDEYQRLTTQRAQAVARWQGYRSDAATVARLTRTVATHHRTRTAAKAVLRHVLYVPEGGLVIARRVWEAKTNSLHQRMIRAAESTGDHERLLEWEQRGEQARERRMDMFRVPFVLAKTLAMASATLVGTP